MYICRMKTTLLFLLIALNCQSQFLGSYDKHVWAGTAISQTTAVIANQVIKKPILSAFIGLSVGCIAGVLKEEWYDRKLGKGTYDNIDMQCTAWGSLVGSINVSVAFNLQKKNKTNLIDYIE